MERLELNDDTVEFVREMRAAGVRKFRCGELEVEFEPQYPDPEPPSFNEQLRRAAEPTFDSFPEDPRSMRFPGR